MDRRQFLKASVAVSAATAVGVKAAESIPDVPPEKPITAQDISPVTNLQMECLGLDGDVIASSPAHYHDNYGRNVIRAAFKNPERAATVYSFRIIDGTGTKVYEGPLNYPTMIGTKGIVSIEVIAEVL